VSFKRKFRRQRKNRHAEILEPIFDHMVLTDTAMSHSDIIHELSQLGHSSHMMPTRLEISQLAAVFAREHNLEIVREKYMLTDAAASVGGYGTRQLKAFWFRHRKMPEQLEEE